jgi:hypothetical protein
MNFKNKLPIAVALLVGLAPTAHTDEISDKGREIFKKQQKTVVTVQVVQKVTYSAGGRSGESQEAKQDLTGTVVDPSGLTVVALSATDPTEMYRRMYGDRYKADLEVSDVKLLLDDGAEISSEIVLRDKDLDIAFVRPKAKLATPMAAVDLNKSSPAQVLDVVVTLNRLGRAASRAYSASLERVSAVVQKPRTFYIPDSSMTGTESGSPAFALDGNIVGIMVLRTLAAGSGASASRTDAATAIILPAAEVLKAAKQAPEAKGENEKKEEPKKETKSEDAKPAPKKE